MTVIQLPEECCCKDCDMVPDFSWTQGGGCSFTFSDDSTPTVPGSPANWWEWDFGDGTTSNLQNPTHDYGTPTDCGAWLVRLRVSCDGGANYRQITKWVTCEPCEFFPIIEQITASGLGPVYVAGVPDPTRCGYVVAVRVAMHGERFPVAATITVDGDEICSSYQVIQQVAIGLYEILCWGTSATNPDSLSISVSVIDSCGCEGTGNATQSVSCGETCVPNCNGILPDEVLVTLAGIISNPLYVALFGRDCQCDDFYDGGFVCYRTAACRWEGKYFVNNQSAIGCDDFVHIVVVLGDVDGIRGYNVQVRIVDRIDPWSNQSHFMRFGVATNGVCVGTYGPIAPYAIGQAPAGLGERPCRLTDATAELHV